MRQVFTIIPAGNGPLWFFGGLSVLLLGLVCMFAWIAYSSQYASFDVSPNGLRLQGDLFGRRIAASALIVGEARAMDLTREPEYRPASRRVGTALPGYAAGWFRLRNKMKALVYLTDRTRVAYLPTQEGYVVLLSVADPERFVQVLKNVVR